MITAYIHSLTPVASSEPSVSAFSISIKKEGVFQPSIPYMQISPIRQISLSNGASMSYRLIPHHYIILLHQTPHIFSTTSHLLGYGYQP